jgi:hypothetical protein
MKKDFMLFFALFSFVICPAFLSAELRVIRLKYNKPEEMIMIFRQLFGKKIDAAPAPTINAVVVNVEDKKILKEIDQLVSELDRKPETLTFSLRLNSESENTQTRLNTAHGFNRQTSASNNKNVHILTALENRKAHLTNDLIRIYRQPYWFGESIEILTISRGLKISGRLIDSHRVQVDLWYSNSEEYTVDNLLTTIEAPLGQWFSIAANSTEHQQSQPGYKMGKQTILGIKNTGGFIHRRYLLKVERAEP